MAATYLLYVFLVMQWHKKDIIVSRISILSFEWQWYIVVMFLFWGSCYYPGNSHDSTILQSTQLWKSLTDRDIIQKQPPGVFYKKTCS